MNLNWSKWWLEFFKSFGRHLGTAGATWVGMYSTQGNIDWHSLWVALVAGAILPCVFTFLQSNPVPDEEAAQPTPPTPGPQPPPKV